MGGDDQPGEEREAQEFEYHECDGAVSATHKRRKKQYQENDQVWVGHREDTSKKRALSLLRADGWTLTPATTTSRDSNSADTDGSDPG